MKRYWAELIGTYVLVLMGCGSALIAGHVIGAAGIALAFGLSLLTMVYVVGPISGCHINPAVTLGMWMAKRISSRDSLYYVLAQVVGAIAASATLYAITSSRLLAISPHVSGFAANGYGIHSPGGYTMIAVLIAEVLFTAMLVLTVLKTTEFKAPAGFAGIPIGLMLTLIHLVDIPIDNASVNPARSIGPALFAGTWAIQQLWLFIVGPCIGAVLAYAIYAALSPQTLRVSMIREEVPVPGEEALR